VAAQVADDPVADAHKVDQVDLAEVAGLGNPSARLGKVCFLSCESALGFNYEKWGNQVSDSKGLGRFFRSEESSARTVMSDSADSEKTIGALQARIIELEGAEGRPSFIDMDEDAFAQIAAEDAAVIIRAARLRAGKLIEQATETLQQAASEREQIRASCELDARQTREAANVDARKIRAEATSTLESARDQAVQLLVATQNDADSQTEENQKVIAKLLDDATRRANNLEKETATQRAALEQELNQLRIQTEKTAAAQMSEAQVEAKRLLAEAIAATQSMFEKATGDARALSEEAGKNYSATISDGQTKLQQAESQAEQIIAQAQGKADEFMRKSTEESLTKAGLLDEAAIGYRDTVLASIDDHQKIFEDLTKQMSKLRALVHLPPSLVDFAQVIAATKPDDNS
jgi:hypothetical protein